MEEFSLQNFLRIKNDILVSCDLSKKGSVDDDIVNLVSLINDCPHYVTLSSCSGRIILVSKEKINTKAGCFWVLVSHKSIDEEELISKIKNYQNHDDMSFKFEPCILHISCRTIQHAKVMQNCALAAGYRNSGMILGKKGKITFAVRSTQNLEVPISYNGELLVTEEYIRYLAQLANEKMKVNKENIRKFEDLCQAALKNIS